MATFDEIKRRAAEAAGFIADKTTIVARITRLTAENTAAKESLKKSYRNIGKLYCDMFGDEPAPELVQLVEEVNSLASVIDEKNAEIEDLKALLTARSWDPCDCDCCCDCEDDECDDECCCKDTECADECCCGEKPQEQCCEGSCSCDCDDPKYEGGQSYSHF